MFSKGDKVVKVINIQGLETATVQEVESVKGGKVRLVDSGLVYDKATGRELDVAPGFAAMGINSRLIVLEGEG